MKTEFYRFKGQDGSLGLKKGTFYVIGLKRYLFSKKILAYIYLTKEGRALTCPYTSIETFNQNWRRM